MKDRTRLSLLPSNSRCTGCFGCANACPTSAIRMVMTTEGFYCSGIDAENCTRCGLCTQHCPVISPPLCSNRSADIVKAFAAWTRNDRTRIASSSGGLFSALARIVFDEGGMVSGAAWRKDWTVSHVMVATEEELAFLRGTKYLQSRVGGAYRRVMQALRETEGPVLKNHITYKYGQGEPIIFIHGIEEDGTFWYPVDRACARFRIPHRCVSHPRTRCSLTDRMT